MKPVLPDSELLDAYARHWGLPMSVRSLRNEVESRSFELLTFAGVGDRVVRLATHGLARIVGEDGTPFGVELLLVAGRDYGRVDATKAEDFVIDVAVHLLNLGIVPRAGALLPPSGLSPWAASAVVFDTPRGEPVELEELVADGVSVRLVWVVPIYPAEADLIQSHGLERFDRVVDDSTFALADLHRPSLV